MLQLHLQQACLLKRLAILTMERPNRELVEYVEREILPRYEGFDAAHRRDHVEAVIERSMSLARHYDVDRDMVYTIAAYHDTGLVEGRERHHTASAAILRADDVLRRWFSEESICVMAEAVADHRASLESAPRSIYGKIVAEADRLIDPQTVIRRTVQYGLSHYAHLDRDGHFRRFCDHLREKYSDDGYLQLWLPESDNAPRLEELRRIIRSAEALLRVFDEEYERQTM